MVPNHISKWEATLLIVRIPVLYSCFILYHCFLVFSPFFVIVFSLTNSKRKRVSNFLVRKDLVLLGLFCGYVGSALSLALLLLRLTRSVGRFKAMAI